MNEPETVAKPGGAAIVADLFRGPAIGLALGLLALGALFRAEAAFAVRTWIDSTAYNHCFLVIPISAYLIWDRRFDLAGLVARPAPALGLLALPLAFLWLIAERFGIMEGRQLAAIGCVEVLFLVVLGRKLWWAISGPLLYLVFLAPFGEFLVPKLQDITAVFIRHGLAISGIPAYIDGYIIEIPEGTFFVAEACAGLRFLIASIAFGALYSLTMYRGPVRRSVFLIASIVVPVVANGFRALGIVVLGHVLGSAQAAAADHVLYGWIFFSLVILLLIVLGLPFRQDEIRPAVETRPAWPDMRAAGVRAGVLAAALPTFVAALGVGLAVAMNLSSARPTAAIEPLDPGLGCVTVAATPGVSITGAAAAMTQRIACGPVEFDIRVALFSPRITAAPLMAERRRLTRVVDAEDVTESWLIANNPGAAADWRMVRSTRPAYTLAVGVWVDGRPARPGMGMRARMALSSMAGGVDAPVVVSVAPALDWSQLTQEEQRQSDRDLSEFLLSHPDIGEQMARLAAKVR